MNKHQATRQPLEDKTPPRVYDEYEIPLADVDPDKAEDWQISREEARTQDFGTIATIALKRLTPLEEKGAVAKARGDSLRMAYELAEAAVAYVIDTEGESRKVQLHDGSTNLLMAQVHPKIRALIMQAYGEGAAPTNKASNAFIRSRKTRA